MRLRILAALCCVGSLASCGQQGIAGNTEITLTIGNDVGPTSEEQAFEIDRVDYRITCAGTAPGSLPIPPDGSGGDYAYDDSVDISGQFEAMEPGNPAIWYVVTSLPPGPCTVTLLVTRNDEVVCSGDRTFTVSADEVTKLNIAMICSLSIALPDGSGDNGGAFQFDIGNECPKLFEFSAHPRILPTDQLTTTIQTVARDLDGTCGNNCDPQTCDTSNPPVCTPGPDLGLVTTLSSSSGLGEFDDANSDLATFSCDPFFPGGYEICVTLSDGDIDCDKRKCITVVCPDLCEGVVCDDGNECTADRCDRSTGLCINEVVPDGLACDGCASTCQGGTCDPSQPYVTTYTGSYMQFDGALQELNTTLTNPYSGAEVLVSGTYNVNVASYKGIGTSNDAINGTPLDDVLFIHDPAGVQRVCGVETILAQNGFDILFLADPYVMLADMIAEGGNANDLLWANAGDDIVRGLNGNDIIDGGPGDDRIEGGEGNDLIALWPGSGFDSINGGNGVDTVTISALQSQILIAPAANPSYQFDVSYNGTPMAQLVRVETIDLLDGTINLTACSGGVCNLCGNGSINGGEECDDGNTIDGDGCTGDCRHE